MNAPLIEIGWVFAGPLDPPDLRAVRRARSRMLEYLEHLFPGFTWRMPVLQRREAIRAARAEPVELLDVGVTERDAQRWDYAIVVTGADLTAYYKPFTLATPSQAVSVAVLSTARIDPAAAFGEADEEQRVEVMTERILALSLHLFGHLNDLPHCDVPADYMFDLSTTTDLDRMQHYSEPAQEQLAQEFVDVADVRLEETGRYRGKTAAFYARATLLGLTDIMSAVVEVRPWQFPFRLSRLTTAATSTMLILIITAEAWDLGMSQPLWLVLLTSVAALLGTTVYLLKRQQLLARRRKQRLSEQRVISNVSISVAVLAGMFTTYALLFVGTFALAQVFFSAPLVEGWAASLQGDIRLPHYLTLSGFVASLGLIIGALGASFEARGYVRHIAYVDEET